MALTTKQRQRLRGLAHHLEPVVQIGKEGLTPGVLAQIDEALRAHELIKVRILSEAPVDRDGIEQIGVATRAEPVQSIGHVLVLFRRRPAKPRVPLRANASTGQRASKGTKPARARGKRIPGKRARAEAEAQAKAARKARRSGARPGRGRP
jgi:RNA-binding protein